MLELRRTTRTNVLKVAKIALQESVHTCIVQDISLLGAALHS
jgi:hypothetical protein